MRNLLITLMVLGFVGSAQAFPTAGNFPAETPRGYHQNNPLADAMSLGDLQFVGQYPSSLSDAERFVLFGCDPRRSKNKYGNMISPLMIVLQNYYVKHGILPQRIDESVIREALPGLPAIDEERIFEKFRSPITGNFPNLSASSFSPGDMYVRILSDSEIQHMAKYDGLLARLVAKQDPTDTTGQQRAELGTRVFYFRVYGERDIILTTLKYAW